MKIRDLILGETGRRYAISEVYIKGKMHKVGLRSLTEEELTKYELARGAAKTPAEHKAAQASQRRRLVAITVVDLDESDVPTDTLSFAVDDIIAMERVDGGLTAKLYDDAYSHVYATRTPVEDIAKNSEATGEGS